MFVHNCTRQADRQTDRQTDRQSTTIINIPLRKHAYSNILNILPPKNENFRIKSSDIFRISAQKHKLEYP